MVLAGGKGSRLGKLTEEIAKPAVPFGGKYRIIDFSLSNCTNSAIMNVGVLTQYQPQLLNEHVGDGSTWGLNRTHGRATILQPYTNTDGEKWFEGTAHSIYQNMEYIDRHDPQEVLILSGDHIYKMDYRKMVDEHRKNKAKLTVGVLPVKWEEASRFGIMNTDDEGRIVEFEEKPENPKSNLASMGIYIFDWPTLREYFVNDTEGKLVDFGQDLIPALLANNEPIYSYSFNGYWKDVGTIESLWQANMEYINPDHELNIRDTDWVIYTSMPTTLPQKVGPTAHLSDCVLADGALVNGSVTHSVISYDCVVEEGAVVKDSVLLPGAVVEAGARVENAIVGEQAVVQAHTSLIGTVDDIAVLGYQEEFGGELNER